MATAITAPAPDEIRARRKAAGLTREELAARADCSLAWLAALERGCIPRRSAVLGRVLAVLAVADCDEIDADLRAGRR